MRHLAALLVGAAVMAGCQHQDETLKTCGADALQGEIGKPLAEADVPEEGPMSRHIRPDSIVTMDLRTDRVNIEVDAEGMITRIKCY